jgi:hypothetical protein
MNHSSSSPSLSNAVYYTINNDSKYLTFLKNSIVSLRNFNKEIKIYVIIFSNSGKLVPDFFDRYNIQVIYKNPVKPYQLTSLKWYGLTEFENIDLKRLIFLDADTIFYDDINLLFEKYNKADFYAREEIGTEDKCPYARGNITITSQLNNDVFNNLLNKMGLKRNPVFSTGIMVFNNSSFKKIPEHLKFYQDLFDAFLKRELPFPALKYHITEEITWAFTIGKIANFSFEFIEPEDTPVYYEFLINAVSKPGIIIHAATLLYDLFLKDDLFPKYILD